MGLRKIWLSLAAIGTAALLPVMAAAQLENNLSAYSGENGKAYVDPFHKSLGASLTDALFMDARIPKHGLNIMLSLHGMVVPFQDEDATYMAQPEDFCSSDSPVEAPTIIGAEQSVSVENPDGTTCVYPGGFNLDNMGMAAPQLDIGSLFGTEAMVRWVAFDTGDAELGDVDFFGAGVRHSISQWFGETFPVDMAGMVFWQNFKIGDDDLIDATTFTIGAQASKSYSIFTPYAGLALDSFEMSMNYDDDEGNNVEIKYDTETNLHFTAGASAQLLFVHLNGQFNASNETSWAFGLGFGR